MSLIISLTLVKTRTQLSPGKDSRIRYARFRPVRRFKECVYILAGAHLIISLSLVPSSGSSAVPNKLDYSEVIPSSLWKIFVVSLEATIIARASIVPPVPRIRPFFFSINGAPGAPVGRSTTCIRRPVPNLNVHIDVTIVIY